MTKNSVMILDQEKITRIKKLLKARPKGLTITDISHSLKLNRNSVAKYLEILLITGQVEVQLYGNAKVYTLSHRVPLSSMLKFSTELILILDSDMRIIDVNDNFLTFFSLQKSDLMGTRIDESGIPGILGLPLTFFSGKESLPEGTDRELNLTLGGKTYYFSIKVVPTVFDDGSGGYTLIFEDVTLSRDFEKKLKMSEERFRAIVEDQTEFICRFDCGFCFTFVNGAVCKFLGQPPGEILGKNMLSYVHPTDRERVRQTILSLSPGQEAETHEQRVIDPSGMTRWHQWTNRAIFDQSGRIVEYQGVGRDITEKKRAEEELQVLNMAVTSSINAIGMATLDGRITYVNDAFLRMFRISRREDIIGQPIETLAMPRKPDGGLKEVMSSIREEGVWSGEMVIHRRDGSCIHTHHTANLVRDTAGTPIAMMASFIDITDRIEAEREIYIKNMAIESATNAIMIFDAGENLIYANRVLLSLFGATDLRDMQENRMKFFWNLTKAFYPTFGEIREEMKRNGKWNGEIRVQGEDGSFRFFQVSTTLVKDDRGQPLCSIGVLMETSAQKAIEKAIKTTYEKLQEAVEFMPDPTFIVGKEGKVIAWNRGLEVLSGIKKQEVIGSGSYHYALSFLHGKMPILVDIINLPVHELAKTYPQVRKFGDSIYVEAAIPLLPDGKERQMWAKATPLYDSEGNMIGAIESFRDISEWKKAREIQPWAGLLRPVTGQNCEIEGLEGTIDQKLLQDAFDRIPDGCAILDCERRIRWANTSFATLFDLSREVMTGKVLTELVQNEDRVRIDEILQGFSEGGSPGQKVHARRGREKKALHMKVFPIRTENGKLPGYLVIVRPPVSGQDQM
ncbi:MAG: PAS domain S-box protein [Methanolinea sp.]|nr:PAS domain S-box protein [Methanolinea sp.]